VLVVVVARDATVRKRKRRGPFVREADRLAVVESLKPVDVALLGSLAGFDKTIGRVKPDVVFLGYDQDDVPGVPAIRSKKRLREYSTSRVVSAIKESLDNNIS
jgi:FAD synthetase